MTLLRVVALKRGVEYPSAFIQIAKRRVEPMKVVARKTV